ncbi:hypothetical protein E1H12_06365 [Geitlerinema sp. P-1104]|nr:hypothetical protein [Geitlerinema sp. P-1104]
MVKSKPPSQPSKKNLRKSNEGLKQTEISAAINYSSSHGERSQSKLSQLQWISIAISVAIGVGFLGTLTLWLLSPKSPPQEETIADIPGPHSEESLDSESDDPEASEDSSSGSSRFRSPPPLSGSPGSGEPDFDVGDRSELPTQRTPQAIYNVTSSPQFSSSSELDRIVEELVNLAASRGLSTRSLSIHLIDLNRRTEASYQSDVFRYPASIPKLFWLVSLYGLQANGQIPRQPVDFPLNGCRTDVCKMAQKSDNEAASRVVDLISNTTSSQLEVGYDTWLKRRYSINEFFENAGYQGLDVSQKNFPIPYLEMSLPKGRDLRMRGNPDNPDRNRLTARQAARLMYELAAELAVSSEDSREMLMLLEQNLDPNVWGPEEYDAIQGFFGEGIFQHRDRLRFYSKVGWTQEGRMEVALIQDSSGRAYILSVFGDGSDYGDDWEIFKQISERVYSQLVF